MIIEWPDKETELIGESILNYTGELEKWKGKCRYVYLLTGEDLVKTPRIMASELELVFLDENLAQLAEFHSLLHVSNREIDWQFIAELLLDLVVKER